ncbi:MAG: GntR family transcriptional regulator [Gemmatirosa sp.]
MSGRLRESITDAMRQRIAGALQRGGLRPGDRLPTTRELATDVDADPRVVAAAYRALEAEGLVEIRPRAGVFVAELPGNTALPGTPPTAWMADVVAQGLARGVPVPALADWFARATTARPTTAAVIAGTLDQAAGLARELRDDFGIAAHGVLAESLRAEDRVPRAVDRANLLVATGLTAPVVRRLAERLGKKDVVIDVRPDLLSPEWRLLLARAAYVVIADPRFGTLVHALTAGVEGGANVRVLVAGRDDLAIVPPDAPTYVTEAARQLLGRSGLPGRVLPPARTLNADSVLLLTRALVERNLAAPR